VRPAWLEAVIGRYPQSAATGNLARFRSSQFGSIGGVAYDVANNRIFVSETSANRIHVVTVTDANNAHAWTIAPLANTAGVAGFANGDAATARFRGPTGLYIDAATNELVVADTGNHVIRAISLSSSMVRTIAGVPAQRGIFGDGGDVQAALFHTPVAVTGCPNGDLFIADTGNHRVRRIAATTNIITTVIGDGTGASSGEGSPARNFPVDRPRGVACDAIGNLFVTSSTTVRMMPADVAGAVDGGGCVQTIYGRTPRNSFPASATSCLSGIAIVDAQAVRVTDACARVLVDLKREPAPPP
jgi:hypothetical protein